MSTPAVLQQITGDNVSLQTDSQFAAQLETAIDTAFATKLQDVHTCLAGILQSYDPATNTATVQPAIGRISRDNGFVNLPLCLDVPVQWPCGGGFLMTFPLHQGDEVILHVSEQALDNWFVAGGTQPPLIDEPTHCLSDCFCSPGVFSQGRVPSSISTEGVEIRSNNGQTSLLMTDGFINIKGNLIVSGTVIAQDFITPAPANIHLGTHLHVDASTGAPSTGGPVNPV